MLFKML